MNIDPTAIRIRGYETKWCIVILGMLAWLGAPFAVLADNAPQWWQTECTETNLLGLEGTTAALRLFPVTSESLELPSRQLTFHSQGFEIRVDDSLVRLRWSDLRNVAVAGIGVKHPALQITITTSSGVVGGRPFGVIEYACWRAIEAIIRKAAPGTIEGSPPLHRTPLYDEKGRVVPEPGA